jgi:hypothetical protein
MTSSTPLREEAGPRSEAINRGEVPLAAAMSIFLFLAFLVLPVAGLLTLPLAGVPMVRLTHRRGASSGFLGAALMIGALLGLGLATESRTEALRMALFGGTIAALPCAFAGMVRAGRNPSLSYLGLCLAGFAIFASAFLIGPGAGADRTAREIDRAFDEILPTAIPAARPELDLETQARVKATFAAAREFAKRYWLGLIGVGWIFGAAISLYTGAWAARPAESAERMRFETLRIPAWIAPAFVVLGAVFALAPASGSRLAGNLLWPLAALYFVGGLSIICHFARKWFRSRLLRVGLYALVVYVPINVGVALLGLFDWYADFRRRGEGVTKQS